MQRFKATLTSVRGGGHIVVVPPEVAEAVGLRYGVRVRGTVDGVAYRSSLMKYRGVFQMGVHKATIEAAGATVGGKVNVAIEIDDRPLPTDTVPPDLQRALKASKRASEAWATLAPSHRREHVKHVLDAKKPETRARRIEKTIEMLEAQPTNAAKKPGKKQPVAKKVPAKKKAAAKSKPARRDR